MPLPKGFKHSEETKRKISLALLGNKFNLGKKLSEEAKQKVRLAMLGKKHSLGHKQTEEHRRKIALANSNENSFMWKGDDVGYWGLHKYIRKYLPEPERCQFCNQKKKLQAACITGVYNRDFTNWRYLCSECHVRYDKKLRGLSFRIQRLERSVFGST